MSDDERRFAFFRRMVDSGSFGSIEEALAYVNGLSDYEIQKRMEDK